MNENNLDKYIKKFRKDFKKGYNKFLIQEILIGFYNKYKLVLYILLILLSVYIIRNISIWITKYAIRKSIQIAYPIGKESQREYGKKVYMFKVENEWFMIEKEIK